MTALAWAFSTPYGQFCAADRHFLRVSLVTEQRQHPSIARPITHAAFSSSDTRRADPQGPSRHEDQTPWSDRHSCATLMHLRGVPIAVIAAWLGHASAAFTMATYAHSQDDALKSAASSFGRVVTTRDTEIGAT